MLVNAGDGRFGAPVTFAAATVSVAGVAAGDVNGDGLDDLVLAAWGSAGCTVLINDSH